MERMLHQEKLVFPVLIRKSACEIERDANEVAFNIVVEKKIHRKPQPPNKVAKQTPRFGGLDPENSIGH